VEKHFNFSNAHKDLIARDAEHVLGWLSKKPIKNLLPAL